MIFVRSGILARSSRRTVASATWVSSLANPIARAKPDRHRSFTIPRPRYPQLWRNTSFPDRWYSTLHSPWLTWPRHAFPVAPPIQPRTSALRVRLSLNSQFLQCPSIHRSPSSLYPWVTRPISTGCDLFVCRSQSKISRVARESES